jgi:hypothetical protein
MLSILNIHEERPTAKPFFDRLYLEISNCPWMDGWLFVIPSTVFKKS